MNNISKLFTSGALLTLLAAAGSEPHTASPVDLSPELAGPVLASASGSLLLIYDAQLATPRLQHASALPVAWRATDLPSATATDRIARVRVLDANGAVLATVSCLLPRGGGPVGTCRGWGDGHDHAAPAQHGASPAEALPDCTAATAVVAPDIAGAQSLVLEEQHGDHWHVVVRTAAAELAAALQVGREMHAAVTYAAAPVQGGVR